MSNHERTSTDRRRSYQPRQIATTSRSRTASAATATPTPVASNSSVETYRVRGLTEFMTSDDEIAEDAHGREYGWDQAANTSSPQRIVPMNQRTQDMALVLTPFLAYMILAMLKLLLEILFTNSDVLHKLMFGWSTRANTEAPEVVRNLKLLSDTFTSKEELDHILSDDVTLGEFFVSKVQFRQTVVEKISRLKNDPHSCLAQPSLLPKTLKVSLHQQILYCDDSGSMLTDTRWADQMSLVNRIANITTRILPDNEGIALHFINQDLPQKIVPARHIGQVLSKLSADQGSTNLGTNLRSKVLQPWVYSLIKRKELDRPRLITIITDGEPTPEKRSELVEAIRECGAKLGKYGYPQNSVKFLVGQIGNHSGAYSFLKELSDDRSIRSVVHCTSDRFDVMYDKYRENLNGLDKWLMETLHQPIALP